MLLGLACGFFIAAAYQQEIYKRIKAVIDNGKLRVTDSSGKLFSGDEVIVLLKRNHEKTR